MSSLTARELALHVARIAWEKDAQDLRVMAFPPRTAICDFCVLVTARSDRQVNAIADETYRFAKKLGLHRHPVEGQSGWMLVDLSDVVLHVFSPELRQLYALDTLWPTVTTIDHEAGFRRLPKLDADKKKTDDG
jgi:ribosome-associated protein